MACFLRGRRHTPILTERRCQGLAYGKFLKRQHGGGVCPRVRLRKPTLNTSELGTTDTHTPAPLKRTGKAFTAQRSLVVF